MSSYNVRGNCGEFRAPGEQREQREVRVLHRVDQKLLDARGQLTHARQFLQAARGAAAHGVGRAHVLEWLRTLRRRSERAFEQHQLSPTPLAQRRLFGCTSTVLFDHVLQNCKNKAQLNAKR